jgi:CDP-diacylglycerol--glycerol-3-phosphate 3-phosphatidyltransferase
MKLTLPNIFSLARILIAPVFLALVIAGGSGQIVAACILFVIGAFTDYFDGWYARRYHEVTKWGKFFDPLADKFLTTAAFIAFVALDIIPMWMVVIIIIRDFGTTFMRGYADSVNHSMKTSKSAKFKTFLQMTFISFILIFLLLKHLGIISVESADAVLFSSGVYFGMLGLTILTVWTAVEYIMVNKNLFSAFWSRIV